ncbi:hypothetical protein V6Z12_A08G152600 [Gossypium hirsutum]
MILNIPTPQNEYNNHNKQIKTMLYTLFKLAKRQTQMIKTHKHKQDHKKVNPPPQKKKKKYICVHNLIEPASHPIILPYSRQNLYAYIQNRLPFNQIKMRQDNRAMETKGNKIYREKCLYRRLRSDYTI